MSITALTLVKNEERWIWFTLQSVLGQVDEILIGDTGSTDQTIPAIKAIEHPSLHFTDYGVSSNQDFTRYRQEQIDAAQSEWVMILDGDELWTEAGLKELHAALDHATADQVMVIAPFYNCIGDIYHYQDEKYGSYEIMGKRGCHTVRLFRKSTLDIHCFGPYGIEGYVDAEGKDFLKTAKPEQVIFLKERYFHTSYLTRSNTLLGDWQIPYRRGKFLNVLSPRPLPAQQALPASVNAPYPQWIRSPKKHRGTLYFILVGGLSQLAYRLYLLRQRYRSRR